MRRVLVTGAGGFSGSHLLRRLVELGGCESCIGITLGASEASALAADVRSCDLRIASAVQHLIEDVRPTHLFHVAGTFLNDYKLDVAGNVDTTHNLLEAVRQFVPQCRVLIVGSSAEYGECDTRSLTITEDAPLRPTSTYGLSKVFQTTLACCYVRRFGLHVVIARPFNLLGSGLSRRLLPGALQLQVAAFRRGERGEIRLGDLTGARDFVDIQDAVSAYLIMIERGVAGEVYNVGSGTLTATYYLVRRVLEQSDIDLGVLRAESLPSGVSRTTNVRPADISKLKRLGWAPSIPFEVSILALRG